MSKIKNLYVVNETGYTGRIPRAVSASIISQDEVDNVQFIRTFNEFIVRSEDGDDIDSYTPSAFQDSPDIKDDWKDIHNSLITVYGKENLDEYVLTKEAMKIDPLTYCYGNIDEIDVIKTHGGLIVLVIRWDTESG